MRMLTVLPVLVLDESTRRCLASLADPDSSWGGDLTDLLIVDNTREGIALHDLPDGIQHFRDPDGHNIGVARAWNIGAQRVLDEGYDYLTLMSTAMLFGPELHTTWHKQVATFNGANVIEADGHSWHLIAFHRSVFKKVGLFDEQFHAYTEAIDFGFRLRLAGLEGGWPRVWTNALSQGSARYVDTIDCPAPPLLEIYRRKWGGDKGEERWVLPYNGEHPKFDGPPLGYFPHYTIPELALRYAWRDGMWW